MNPIAFSISGFDVRWYGIMISFAILVALFIAYINVKKRNMDFNVIIDLFLWGFPFAIIGARTYYVIFEWDYYKNHLDQILNIRGGGIAIHGALIGAILTAFIYCKIKKVDFLKYADVAIPSIIIAQGIGRWGNFFNSEAHGGEVSKEFISHFPKFIQNGMFIGGKYYHPTFLYESIWDILIGVILIIILYKLSDKYKGIVLASYGILYSVGRYFIEGLRTDSLYIGNIRMAQLISIVIIIVSAIYMIYIFSKNKKTKGYEL